MKRFVGLLFGAALLSLVWGCSEKDAEVPEEEWQVPYFGVSEDLISAMAWNYWKDAAYFVDEIDGEEVVSKKSLPGMRRGDPSEELGSRGFNYGFPGIFYLNLDGWADVFFMNGCWQDSFVVRRAYKIMLDSVVSVVPRLSGVGGFCEESWYLGQPMYIRSMSPDQIEFDMPISDLVRTEWAEFISADTKCLRVIWTRVRDMGQYGDLVNMIEHVYH